MPIEDIKLQSNALHNKEWSRIEGITKKIWNGTIAKSYCFFFYPDFRSYEKAKTT